MNVVFVGVYVCWAKIENNNIFNNIFLSSEVQTTQEVLILVSEVLLFTYLLLSTN